MSFFAHLDYRTRGGIFTNTFRVIGYSAKDERTTTLQLDFKGVGLPTEVDVSLPVTAIAALDQAVMIDRNLNGHAAHLENKSRFAKAAWGVNLKKGDTAETRKNFVELVLTNS